MTKLTNSEGKILYKNPENIKRASKRRRNTLYCGGLRKYNASTSLFRIGTRELKA